MAGRKSECLVQGIDFTTTGKAEVSAEVDSKAETEAEAEGEVEMGVRTVAEMGVETVVKVETAVEVGLEVEVEVECFMLMMTANQPVAHQSSGRFFVYPFKTNLLFF